MEGRINYKKRRKGLLAAVTCMALLVGMFYHPMVAEAASDNTVYVTGADTSILVGYGDSVGFTGGIYGRISLDGTAFPSNESYADVTIYNAGASSGSYVTDETYTIEYSGGLCVKESIEVYSYDQVVELMQQQNGAFSPGNSVEVSDSFAVVTLKKVNGCKVTYKDDEGTVVRTDYVVTDANSPVNGTATTTWDGLTKENAVLIGWSFSQGSNIRNYELGASLMDASGTMSLYPVWAIIPEEEEPEPEPEPEPAKPEKSSGKVSVSMSSYIYGGSASSPQISSSTNDVGKATVEYKPASADDSAYSSQKPSSVGNYTVRVTLPSNDDYTRAVGTANFSISYLRAPSPAYELDGAVGDSGWYKSEVEITAPEGYELSVGNRDNFTSEAYVVEEETTNLRIYLRKTATGEQTDMISIANLRVDAKMPEVKDIKDGEEIYADTVELKFEEANLKAVSVDGKEAEVIQNEDGSYSVAMETGMRRLTHVLSVKDEAGNETKISLITGPAWLKDGIIGEGNYYLETGMEYHTPEGSQWSMAGDATIYAGGIDFYANKEGEFSFSRD
ncbi:MAG: hypothetical protein J6A73_04960 [Lachnospiraceae bacterium]|nr:hypothetical protein [Lachnospiraceae bacterium]